MSTSRFGAVLAAAACCLSACSGGVDTPARPSPTVEEIESAVAALDDDWVSGDREQATDGDFTPMCADEADDADLGFVEGSFVEVGNDSERIGVRQSVALFGSSSAAEEYVAQWRGSPLVCVDVETVERPLVVAGADDVVRLDAMFPEPADFAQQLAIVRYDEVVVLIGVSVEGTTDLDNDDLDGLIRLLVGSER